MTHRITNRQTDQGRITQKGAQGLYLETYTDVGRNSGGTGFTSKPSLSNGRTSRLPGQGTHMTPRRATGTTQPEQGA